MEIRDIFICMYVFMYRFFYGTFTHASTNNLDSTSNSTFHGALTKKQIKEKAGTGERSQAE